MKGWAIIVLGVNLLAVSGLILPAASSIGAQDDIQSPGVQSLEVQSLGVLAGHLRPRWILADYRTDLAPTDDTLASVNELKLKSNAKRVLERPSLLLIFSDEDQVSQMSFEQILFQHPDLVLGAKAFVCLRLDVRKNKRIEQVYDGSVPRFLIFDKKGRRRADISMAGFRQRPGALLEMMKRIARGYGSIPLGTFIQRYTTLLKDLVPIDSALRKLADQKAKLARQRGAAAQAKAGELEAKRQEWLAKRKAWLSRERALFGVYHGKKK